jgi:hypothetical protein
MDKGLLGIGGSMHLDAGRGGLHGWHGALAEVCLAKVVVVFSQRSSFDVSTFYNAVFICK